jgi:hypothetical protein
MSPCEKLLLLDASHLPIELLAGDRVGMNKITLDPSSLIAGAALTLVATFAMGAQSSTPQPPAKDAAPTAHPQAPARPAARDLVLLESPQAFTVPAGRYLVITGVGHESDG